MAEKLNPAVLVCERDAAERQKILDLLCGDYQLTSAASSSEALALIRRGAYNVLLLSISSEKSLQDLDPLQAIPVIHRIDPDLQIIAMMAEDCLGEREFLEWERKIRSQKIFYFILKPVDMGELGKVLREAVQSSHRMKNYMLKESDQ